MAYGTIYTTSYSRRSRGLTTVNILKSGWTGNSSTLIVSEDPLELSFSGDVNNIYVPTIGSGAVLNAYIDPLSLIELFTIDAQEYKVQIIDNSTGKTTWQGFINTGIYNEEYRKTMNSPVSIYCNDGMAVLNDIPYIIDSSTQYTGFSYVKDVVIAILSKLNLDFDYCYISNNLGVDVGEYNLLDTLIVNNENYYDEDGIPMSCRQVLDSIFSGLGLVFRFIGRNIFIYDPINLHTAGGFRVDTSTFLNPVDTNLGGYLNVADASISWYTTGMQLDVVQPFNQIELKADPYIFLQGGYNFNQVGNASKPYVYEQFDDNAITYRIYSDISMNGWLVNSTGFFSGIQEVNTLDNASIDYFYKQKSNTDTGKAYYEFPYSLIKQDQVTMLELSIDVYLNTKNKDNIISPSETGYEIKSIYVGSFEIKVGDNYWNDASQIWQSTACECAIYVRELDAKIFEAHTGQGTWWRRLFGKPIQYEAEDTSRVNDQWTTAVMYIPLYTSGVTLEGGLSLSMSKDASCTNASFYNGSSWTTGNITVSEVGYIKSVLLKDISVKIVDLAKNELNNNSISIVANMTDATNVKKNTLGISLTSMTIPYGSSKAAFSSDDSNPAGTNIIGLYRTLDPSPYKTTDYICQNMLSQYNEQRIKLNGILKLKTDLTTTATSLIKDTAKLEQAFYITSANYSDIREIMNVEMLELTSTREPIISYPVIPVVEDTSTYEDWFLPSSGEMTSMYTYLKAGGTEFKPLALNIGELHNAGYWTSVEYDSQQSYFINMTDGTVDRITKNSPYYVRAARKFDGSTGLYDFGDVGPAGGLIFAIVEVEAFVTWTYYEASPSNLTLWEWSNIHGTGCPGAEGTGIGDGTQNTLDIIAQVGHTDSAAHHCQNYKVIVLL